MTSNGHQRFAAMTAGGYGGGVATLPPPAVRPTVATTVPWPVSPVVDGEALRHQAAAVLQHCYQWLERAVQVVPESAELVPALVTAVQQYQARQYHACLAQVTAVVQTVRQLRLVVPALPPL